MVEYKGDKTWAEVQVGEIVRHQFTNDLLLKISDNKFFNITDNRGSYWPQMLQEGHDQYRLFYSINTIQHLTAPAEDNI